MALTEMVTGRSAVLPLYDTHHGQVDSFNCNWHERAVGGAHGGCSVSAL